MLLQAAAFDPERAAASYRAWLAGNDVACTDETSLRLLPAVDFNLRHHGIDNPLAPLLAGLRRHAFARTHCLTRTAAQVVSSLHERRIPCLVLKGAAVSRIYAPSPSVRPMNDLDLLVPRRNAGEAMASLAAQGFRAHAPRPSELIAVRHSTPFSRGALEIDLHWEVLPESHALGDTWPFEGARPLDLGGVTSVALSPTLQLFHTIAHGLRYSHTRAAWWPLDALFVLRASPDVDFDLLARIADEHHLSHVLHRGLSYLARHLELEIPNAALTRLARAPRGVALRIEDAFRMHRVEPLGELPLHVLRYRRLTSELSFSAKLRGLPRYLSRVWQLEPQSSLAAAFSRKAAHRVRAWLAARAPAAATRTQQAGTQPR